MRQFQPISYEHLPFEVKVNLVKPWNNMSASFEPTNIEVVNTDQEIRFRISAIHMQFEGGKLWQSVFVPVDETGREGFSITWWGKELGVKGQTQVKRVNEAAWYDTVKTKYVKGYEAISYMGRIRSDIIKIGHEFVDQLHAQASARESYTPCPALDARQYKNIMANKSIEGVGHAVGDALTDIKSCASIIWKCQMSGLDLPNAIYSEFKHTTIHNAFNDGLVRSLAGNEAPTPHGYNPKIKKEPVPQIDREEVYGSGWGNFG